MKLKKLINSIKRYFKKNNMSYDFENIKVKALEDKINLKENATTDGKNNIPRSNSENFSICENEAIVYADEIRNDQVSKAASYLNSIKDKIIDSTAKLGQQNFYIEDFKGRIQQTLVSAEGRLSSLKDSFNTHDREVRNFKMENKLDREPKSLTTMNIIIGLSLLLIMFIIEYQANGRILGPALGGGNQAGFAVSASIAALNVLVSFGIGFFALKNFNHIKQSRRVIGKIGLTIYLVFIFYLNWILGAYRSIHDTGKVSRLDAMRGKTSSVEQGAQSANELLPWTVDLNFISMVLIFLGIGFAIASLIDGYFFGDTYPEFGNIGKTRNEDKKEINRIREHLATEVQQIFKNEIKDTGEKRDSILSNILRKQWRPNITSLENTFSSYKRFANEIDDSIDHALGEYRSINANFRTDDVPKYWKDANGKMKTRYYNLSPRKSDPKEVFSDITVLYLSKDEIEKKIESYQNKIQSAANDHINLINTYESEINLKIEDMRKKYEI
tara:strand:- start:221 stop:1720 length:1500 start_codon:yes stop_codon:yes gene_type:complete